MSWPKKNEGMRLYYERKHKSYILITDTSPNWKGEVGGLGELLINNDPDNPMLVMTMVSPVYTYQKCKRASWNDLPKVWKKAFLDRWFNQEPIESPLEHRGLWRMEELKAKI